MTFDPRTQTAARRRQAHSQPAEASPSASSFVFNGAPSNGETGFQTASQHDSAAVDDEAESPAVSSPLLPVLPRFLNGNSLSVLTQWLDLAFARLGMTQRLHSTYKAIRASEKRPSYAGLTLLTHDVLPPYEQVESQFSTSMGWLFSVPEGSVSQAAGATNRFNDIEARPKTADVSPQPALGNQPANLAVHTDRYGEASTPTPHHPSFLHALMYAVISAADTSENSRALAERCFGYAYNALPAILEATGAHALDSIRALVLISLYLRWRDDAEKAWQILSLAIASVHNQSLHREHHRSPTSGSQDLFWSVFVLDKLLSIELERKPMLTSAECNRARPLASQGHDGSVFGAVVDLSVLQDEILEKLQSSRRNEEEAHASQNPTVLRRVIQDKLRLVVELDQKLLQFADGLPHGLRPTDYSYAEHDSLPGLTFLAVQYYQAVFLVSRNALLINMQTVQSEIDKIFEGSPTVSRLRNGMNVCANAARSILNVLNHAEEVGVRSPLLTPYAPLMAMYALTIHVVKRQPSATAKVDIELQATAMNLIRNSISLQQTGGNGSTEKGSGLFQMLERLHKFSESYIGLSTHPEHAPNNTSTPTDTFPATGSVNQWRPHDMAARVISPPQSPANRLPSTGGALPISAMLDGMGGATSAPGQDWSTVPLPDFNNDWLLDMGTDAMAIDWDELALTLGLPTEQR